MKLRSVLGFNNIGTACLLQVSGNTAQHVFLREVREIPADPAKGLAEEIEAGFLEQLNKPGTFAP